MRQLNYYGFTKGKSASRAASKTAEFAHPHFLRDQPHRLQLIRRKTAEDYSVKTTVRHDADRLLVGTHSCLGRVRCTHGSRDMMYTVSLAVSPPVCTAAWCHDAWSFDDRGRAVAHDHTTRIMMTAWT